MYARETLYHIESWLRRRDELVCRVIGEVSFLARETDAWMTCEEALRGPFSPIRPGDRWGTKWGYGWFKGTYEVPAEAAGRRLELLPDFGGESTLYLNGRLAGAKDHQHRTLTLTVGAVPGQSFEIVAESYAGHEQDRELPVFGTSRVAVIHEECYQFLIDLQALLQVRNGLEPGSLRVSEIDGVFRKLVAELDWNGEDGTDREAVARRGRALVKPLMACVNGSTAPRLFMVGQSHLDIAWLWPLEETKRKIARTLSNQLALMEQYPEYRYMQSQPYLLQMTKELYPELYARVKRHAAEGRIIVEGGAWVEPDTNLPGGESLVRQFLHGKRFIREEFGTDSTMLWLPDVFGYSGNLPQIMRKCGVRYFASVKMFQTYENVADPFPYNTFTWEGIDGSSVSVHLLDYGPYPNPLDVSYAMFQWNGRVQKEGLSTRLVQFGHGDGGGGATRDDLEFLRRIGDLEGVPRAVIASPIDYFEDQEARGMPEARYAGELYYPAHRGTLTTQAGMKTGNRRSEFALREAELWSAWAAVSGRQAYPRAQLDEAWRGLLLLQFHDVLPGTSIARVHEEAARQFADVLRSAGALTAAALAALTGGAGEEAAPPPDTAGAEQGTVYFNSLSWRRTALVELAAGCEAAVTAEGGRLAVQPYRNRTLARVVLPAMGSLAVLPAPADSPAAAADRVESGMRAAVDSLENDLLLVRFNAHGEIERLLDKETGTEWLSGLGNRFRMFRDNPSNFDAWEIDRRYASSPVELTEPAAIAVTAQGPLFAELRVERKLNRSLLVQEIRLEAGSRRLEFRTTVDWKEKHKLLKVEFETDLRAGEVMSEIQFGYLKRPTHASRPHDADRFEISQHKWSALAEGNRSFSLLNDCKYGLSVEGKRMNLTLLRAPGWPDEHADAGVHTFTYAVHVWNGGFASDPVVREGYELNAPVQAVPGTTAPAGSLFACGHPAVIVDTVKLAEDGSGDLIARIYESKGAAARAVIAAGPAIANACETDMLETAVVRDLRDSLRPEGIELSFGPFEVRTIRMSLKSTK